MNVAPWWTPCPVIVSIMDLAYMRYPHVHPRGRRLYLTALTRLTVRQARAVAGERARQFTRRGPGLAFVGAAHDVDRQPAFRLRQTKACAPPAAQNAIGR